MDSPKAHGGTMIMWKSKLDPYISPLTITSSSFLPVLLNIPGFSKSIHIALYLPTAGRNSEFVSALALLDSFLQEAKNTYNCPIFIRGDANCNPHNQDRYALFNHFCSKHAIHSIDFKHPSHHHFSGAGLSDAQLDVLLHLSPISAVGEELSNLVCKLENPLINSAHDLIVSRCHLPSYTEQQEDQSENITAPKVSNDRVKIKWDDENIPLYNTMIAHNLERLRKSWSNAASPTSISILLQSTNSVLSAAAVASNNSIKLDAHKKIQPKVNPDTQSAKSNLLKCSRLVKDLCLSQNPCQAQLAEARLAVCNARSTFRQADNLSTKKSCDDRDSLVHSVLDSNPGNLFNVVKSLKSASTSKIQTLKVGVKSYKGSSVPYGFFRLPLQPEISRYEPYPLFSILPVSLG